MKQVDTPQTRCRAGVARGDITPPVGIYHRMWGAATHDRAASVHRPLLATLLWLEPYLGDASQAQLLVGLDHCVIDSAEMTKLREAAASATGLQPTQVQISLSHTHGSGWLSRSRSHFPGGELIGPYLDDVVRKIGDLARQAKQSVQPATIVYGQGRCNLAAHRDYFDADRGQYVCGFNPAGAADDLVQVAKVCTQDSPRPPEEGSGVRAPSSPRPPEEGSGVRAPSSPRPPGEGLGVRDVLATIVNYACHPTTLAWDNTAISPDYVGAMREVIEQATGAPCLFLQGVSGDLGPREGFVGDHAVADRNGRQLGHAALSALTAMNPPGTRFVYAGPVVSGTTIGTWKHVPLDFATLKQQETWFVKQWTVELPYRHDLASLEETKAAHAKWQEEEAKARAAGDAQKARDCRALVEQANRQITRLSAIPPGKVFPYRVTIARFGDALWVLVPGELYQTFQMTLRYRFPMCPIIVATLTGDWQPGYLPAAWAYGYGIYQDTIACVGPGALEVLIESIAREIATIVG